MSFQTGPTQTGLHSHIRWLEAVHFGFRKKRNCTIYVAKTLALSSCALVSCIQKAGFLMTGLIYLLSFLYEGVYLPPVDGQKLRQVY